MYRYQHQQPNGNPRYHVARLLSTQLKEAPCHGRNLVLGPVLPRPHLAPLQCRYLYLWRATCRVWCRELSMKRFIRLKGSGKCVLYCTALYCTVLYSTLLYCTLLYSTVLYCTLLYSTVLYSTLLYCIVLYCTVLYCTVLYCTVQC